MQPVHAVDAHWPMVDLAVEVTLAQQRRLTLVETYVLRAFSEINGVTVSETEQNLGLDLQIIKTVMMNLKQCRAINTEREQRWMRTCVACAKNLAPQTTPCRVWPDG